MNNYTTIEILEKGLISMTKACDALIDQNKQLVLDIKEMKQMVKHVKERVNAND